MDAQFNPGEFDAQGEDEFAAAPQPSALIQKAHEAHDAGYEVIACHGKAAIDLGWQQGEVTKETIQTWNDNTYITNIGIRTGAIIAVDIDLCDAAKSERVKNLALSMLGDTRLVRIGQNPKQLLVYRVAVPFRKKQITGEINPATGKPVKVEVLAKGQQFIAYGRHPDTRQNYVWTEADLTAVPAKDVPIASEEALEEFLIAAQEIIGQTPKPARVAPPPVQGHGRNGHDNGPSDKGDAIEALYAIPGDLEYDEWIRVGFALYAALGAGGYGQWLDWSARSDKNVPATTAKKWPTFAQGREIHAETLFWIARHHGWKPEREKQRADVSSLNIFKERKYSETPDADGEFRPIEDEFSVPPALHIRTGGAFRAEYVPLEYVVDDLLPRSTVITVTAKGNTGKTALGMRLAGCAANGQPFAGREVAKCHVVYCCAENPVDFRHRYIAMVDHWPDFDESHFHVLTPISRPNLEPAELAAYVAGLGVEVGLVLVDTQAAWSPTTEENNNTEQRQYAQGLRAIIPTLPGSPAVVVLSHPTKTPQSADECRPRGGVAFENETDGNWTMWQKGTSVEIAWTRLRVPPWEPFSIRIKEIASTSVVDRKGRPLKSVMAEFLSDADEAQASARDEADALKILRALFTSTSMASAREVGISAGIILPGMATDHPDIKRVRYLIKRMKDPPEKYIEYVGKRIRLSAKGKTYVSQLDE